MPIWKNIVQGIKKVWKALTWLWVPRGDVPDASVSESDEPDSPTDEDVQTIIRDIVAESSARSRCDGAAQPSEPNDATATGPICSMHGTKLVDKGLRVHYGYPGQHILLIDRLIPHHGLWAGLGGCIVGDPIDVPVQVCQDCHQAAKAALQSIHKLYS